MKYNILYKSSSDFYLSSLREHIWGLPNKKYSNNSVKRILKDITYLRKFYKDGGCDFNKVYIKVVE